jgi:pimeloyl-ACP methyl ester carboxylesterase
MKSYFLTLTVLMVLQIFCIAWCYIIMLLVFDIARSLFFHHSGKWWGSHEKQPVLALHGWQDNAGTFDTLAPLLSLHIPVLCIDLPGHGFSSHYPKGQFYYLWWDGLILIRRIVKHYGWEKVTILGHSLGGTIGFLYAATFPQDTEKLICIDIAGPAVRSVPYFVQQTGGIIDQFLLGENLTEDTAPSYIHEEMLRIMLEAYKGALTKESCEIMLKRGSKPVLAKDCDMKGERFRFSRDSRLKFGALGFLSLDMTLEYASKITCEVLNIRGKSGMQFDPPESYHIVLDKIRKSAKKLEFHEVEGTHFLHLNNPESICPIIVKFLG